MVQADMVREDMVLEQGLGIGGVLRVWLMDPCSLTVESKRTCPNLIVPAGRAWVAGKCANTYGPTGLSDIAVGTGNSVTDDNTTALDAEVARAKLSMTPWQGTGDNAHKFYIRAAFTSSEAVATLAEAGAFFGGSLFSRTLIAPTIDKPDGKILVMQWEFTCQAA